MKKTILMIVFVIIIAGISGGSVYLWQKNKESKIIPQQKVETLEIGEDIKKSSVAENTSKIAKEYGLQDNVSNNIVYIMDGCIGCVLPFPGYVTIEKTEGSAMIGDNTTYDVVNFNVSKNISEKYSMLFGGFSLRSNYNLGCLNATKDAIDGKDITKEEFNLLMNSSEKTPVIVYLERLPVSDTIGGPGNECTLGAFMGIKKVILGGEVTQ